MDFAVRTNSTCWQSSSLRHTFRIPQVFDTLSEGFYNMNIILLLGPTRQPGKRVLFF